MSGSKNSDAQEHGDSERYQFRQEQIDQMLLLRQKAIHLSERCEYLIARSQDDLASIVSGLLTEIYLAIMATASVNINLDSDARLTEATKLCYRTMSDFKMSSMEAIGELSRRLQELLTQWEKEDGVS